MMRAAPGLLVLPVSPKARRLPSRKPGGLFCLQNSEFIMSHPSKPIDQADLVYGLEDRPPFGNALLSAITHLLAIFVPMITPALIVGRALELPVDMTAYLVSMAMVASGVGTWLQVNRFGPLGSGMLSIQSVNFSFVTVMIALGTSMKAEGLDAHAMISALLGVSFVGAFLVCFSAWLLPYLKKVITPTVSGVVVMLLLIVLFFNCMKNPLLRMSGIAVGLVIGYLIALFWGKVDFSSLNGLPLVTIPVPFKYGFAFDSHAFVVAGAIYLLSVFEAVGDLTATAMVSGQPIEGDEYTRRLRGGVLADGLVSVIATALGSLPLTTFAQNNGVIQMTGVASRHVGKYIAVILVLLGLFPVVGRIFTTIPAPVLGGAMVLMFGLITIAGVRILMTNGIRRRETIIAATSVGLGLGVAFEPEVFQQLPVLFQNSISAGGITAVVLNLLLPLDQTEKPVFLSDDLE